MNGSAPNLPMHNQRKSASMLSIRTVLGIIALSLASFYSGLMLGLQSADSKCQQCLHQSASAHSSIEKIKGDILGVLKKRSEMDTTKTDILGAVLKDTIDLAEKIENAKTDILGAIQKERVVEKTKETPLIPDTMKSLFAGMALVNRDDFFEKFDVGVPKDDTKEGNEEVLVFYSSEEALPKNYSSDSLALHSVDEATKQCNTMKVVFTQPGKRRECLALVGQWESYHVHKYMRLPPGNKNIEVNLKHPLRYVSRMHGDSGLLQRVPTPAKVKEYDQALVAYLSSLDKVLEDLKPIAQKVARDNTIIVMVCNHGQSELLMNFACSARARGIALSQVLVFATDLETKALAEGLGMATFYDQTNFEKIPKAHAAWYGDETFGEIMMAKLFSAHMINLLGYDLLFQDVDVVWYRNPLGFFSDKTSPYYDYDIYFQDDGARTVRFASYSPNSGFYFVRHNERTEYFMHSLLMAGNVIAQSGSHQNAVAAVLNEHASWRGLHVKTLNSNMEEFPGGFHYQESLNHKKVYRAMKDLVEGKSKPYIFHMSWTGNKDDKKCYFEQMGEWYVKEKCVGRTADKIVNGSDHDLGKACCVAEPAVKCHYRDRPSKIPCKDSPPLQEGHGSWW